MRSDVAPIYVLLSTCVLVDAVGCVLLCCAVPVLGVCLPRERELSLVVELRLVRKGFLFHMLFAQGVAGDELWLPAPFSEKPIGSSRV